MGSRAVAASSATSTIISLASASSAYRTASLFTFLGTSSACFTLKRCSADIAPRTVSACGSAMLTPRCASALDRFWSLNEHVQETMAAVRTLRALRLEDRAADTIVVLNHGRIAERGTHEQLMAIARGIYQRLYLLQQIGE